MATRLVFLIRDLGPGGAQRQLVALAAGLAKRPGWAVSVLHFYPGVFEGELQRAGVETVCIGKRHRWDLVGFGFRLIKALRRVRPQVLHSYLNEANLMAILLKPLCGWPRVIWGVRDSQTDAHQWGVLGKLSFGLNAWLSGFADLIIANSEAGRGYYAGLGYPAKRIEVVANGIDTERFAPVAAPGLRREWGGGEGVLFGIIGRLNPMKDHGTFIQAAALAAKARSDLRFVIIGDGPEEYRRELQTFAEQLGVAERITWSGARDDMPAVYGALDVVVSTSAFGEGFSNVLAEAMACGRPCLTTNVGDSARLVERAEWVCHPGDAGAIAQGMLTLARMTPEKRAELGAAARRRIAREFTLERMTERTAELLTRAAHLKRVVFVTTGLGTGGAEMMLWQILSRLDRGRFSPAVISLTAGGRYQDLLKGEGIPVESLDLPPGKVTLAGLCKLLRSIRRLRPEMLVGWMYHGCLAASVAKFFQFRRVPVIWGIRQSLYGLEFEKRGSSRVIRMLAGLSWLPKAILYNSRISAQQHEELGYSAEKRQLVANGFDLQRWQPQGEDGRRAEPLRPFNGANLIGRFGRYAAMKDFPAFLEAAALISKESPHAEFILAGTNVDPANAELAGEISRLGLGDRVHLLGEREDLPALTKGLDIAVSSSAFGEGFPNVVGEAMACAVPVVATDVGDTAWVLGDAGKVVSPKDPEAIARACLELLRLPAADRRSLGMMGRRRIEDRFSLQAAVQQLEGLLG